MGVKVKKQGTPAGAIGVDGKCFQFKETRTGAPDNDGYNAYVDCNDCGDTEGSETGDCSRRYSRCDNPDIKVYLPCNPYSDTFIKKILTGDCYSFDEIDNDVPFDHTWAAFERNIANCNVCAGNVILSELLGCRNDIVISGADHAAFGNKSFIRRDGKCYLVQGFTGNAVNALAEAGYNGKCACVEEAEYNVEWEPCAGKKGFGPNFIVKDYNFHQNIKFLKIERGCYQRPTTPCNEITCDPLTGGKSEAFPSCDQCEPDALLSSDDPAGGGGGGGGGGAGPQSEGDAGAESSFGNWGSSEAIPFSGGTNCIVYQNCDDPNDEINIPEWHSQFAQTIRIGGVDGTCYDADGKLYTDVFQTPVIERFDSCAQCTGAEVQVLLQFNGETGADIIPELSCNIYDVAVNGDAQITATSPLFGRGNLTLDGTGDSLTLTPTFTMLEDFAIEFFVNLSSAVDQGFVELTLDADNPTTNKTRLEIYTDALGYVTFNFYESDVLVLSLADTGAIATGSFEHIAVTREGTTWRLFVSGVLVDNTTDSSVIPDLVNLTIGRLPRLSLSTTGEMAEYRITTGAPMYTVGFTPPTSAFSMCDTIHPPEADELRVKADFGYNDMSVANRGITNNGTTIVENELNGLDVFDFDGSSSILLDTAISSLTDFHCFIVFKPDTAIASGDNTDEALIGPQSAGAYANISIGTLGSQSNEVLMLTESSVGSEYATDDIPAQFNLLDISNSLANEIRQGGDLKSLTTETSAPTALAKVEQIGAYLSSQYLNGQIAEIVIYGRKLSISERNTFYSYIASEYGI